MKKKTLSLLLATVLTVSAVTGCQSSSVQTNGNTEESSVQTNENAEESSVQVEETTEESTTQAVENEDRSVTVTDMSGDEVTIEGNVEKIVNLWPAGTSSFFVMGAGELISALGVNNPGTINSWSELFYPGAGEIPSMGGTTPAIEELMNMDPDLVIVHPATVKDGFAQQIRDAGIPAININFSTYDDMMISYSMLGTVLGGVYQERLDTWCDMVSEKQEEVNAITEKLTDEEKPVVYYIAGQSDSLTTTMGMNSICADWTALAGGTYAMSLMDEPNATEVTAEEIFAIDPDVIIVGGTYQHKLVEELENTDGWKDLSAVVNNRVYTNPYGAFSWDRFGLESYLQMDYALMCIQPELAEASDVTRDSIIDEVIDFYKIMNGTELTKEQAGNMLDGIEPDGTEVDPDAAGAGMGGGRG